MSMTTEEGSKLIERNQKTRFWINIRFVLAIVLIAGSILFVFSPFFTNTLSEAVAPGLELTWGTIPAELKIAVGAGALTVVAGALWIVRAEFVTLLISLWLLMPCMIVGFFGFHTYELKLYEARVAIAAEQGFSMSDELPAEGEPIIAEKDGKEHIIEFKEDNGKLVIVSAEQNPEETVVE